MSRSFIYFLKSLLFLNSQLLFKFFLFLTIFELFLSRLVWDRDFAKLVILLLEKHLLLRFFLREDHIKILIIKVISNAVSIPIDNICVNLLFFDSFLLNSFVIFGCNNICYHFFERFFLSRKTIDYHIFAFIMFVIHELL